MSNSRSAVVLREGFLARNFPTLKMWIGNLGWPILLKQLRTEFRKNRFFYSHFICLAILGGSLFLIITTKASDLSVTPTQVGLAVFNWFWFIQVSVIYWIFPAFSATAFTEKKSNLSLDLLVMTTLSSEEVVSGKFLASSIYCLLYVMATVPLLAISFLFGGVQVEDVLLAYGILIALTLLVSMLSLCVSSCFRSNVGAILCVYALLLFMGGCLLWFVIPPWKVAWEANPNQTVLQTAQSGWKMGGETVWLQ